MKAIDSDWYKKGWSLEAKKQSWVENTIEQVDFLVKQLHLTGKEKILDLGCGFGRHSLEFAKRGYHVVGVDITKDFIEDAKKEAMTQNLSAEFILSDIREVSFYNEFDVVINMADGAIGYLENDEENAKIFDVVAKALKPGGKHFMDIVSADYAKCHFPCQLWDAGKQGLTLSKFEWNSQTKIMLYGQIDISYGDILQKPKMNEGCPTRLYGEEEVHDIMKQRGMQVIKTYSTYKGKAATKDELQLMVYSQKK